MGRISNTFIIVFTIVSIIIIIGGFSIHKYNVEHNKKLLYSMEENIKYYAKRCYIEEKCKNEITIQDLYDNGYMSEIVNPVTKEVLDHNTKINYINKEIVVYFK